jgi:ankyrin repeat protein
LEDVVEREDQDNRWSYSGELPIDPAVMSNVYPYAVAREKSVYMNRMEPPAYSIRLSPVAENVLPWKSRDLMGAIIVYGWVANNELTQIACSSSGALDRYKAALELNGKGLDPDGRMIAWVVDSSGSPIPIDRKLNPCALLGLDEVSVKKPMDRNKNTALHVAALNGDIDMVAGLLDKRRFRIESKNIYGQTPLMFAAMAGRTNVVDLLLEREAKFNVEDKSRRSPLSISADLGHLDIVKLLIPDAASSQSEIPHFDGVLLETFKRGHQDVAIYLGELVLEFNWMMIIGVDSSKYARDFLSNGKTRLFFWIQEQHNIDGSYATENGINFMHAVAGYADVELLEKLKEGGASVSQAAEGGITPLLIACGVGNRESICWLIDNGGRNESVSTKHDPLMYAIGKRVEESVSCLIDYGFDVNRDVGGGLSSLLLASLMGEKKIAEMLLEAGAVWDFQSAQSENALRQLIRMDSPELLNGLFEQGLDREHKLMGMIRMEEVAGFYGARKLLGEMDSMTTAGLSSMLNAGKMLERAPSLAFQTEISYPSEFQEQFGDLDVEGFFAVMPSGHIGMIQLSEDTPKYLHYIIENTLMNWRFNPTGGDEMVAIKMMIPMRTSLSEEDIFSLAEVGVMPKAIFQVGQSTLLS